MNKDSYIKSIAMEFSRIPADAFLMGASDSDSHNNEKPHRKVKISCAFLLVSMELQKLNGKQLWEYACHAGTQSICFLGDNISNLDD